MRNKIIDYLVEHNFESYNFRTEEDYREHLYTLTDDHLSFMFDVVFYYENPELDPKYREELNDFT